jgi:phospholipid-binding lipoprotein MlaA
MDSKNFTTATTPRFNAVLDLLLGKLSNSLSIALMVALIVVLGTSTAQAATDQDPLERVNRVTHKFNTVVDGLFIKPLAKSYDLLTPSFAKKGIRNIFSNLDDVKVTVNDVLQLKFDQAAADFGRFAINSTVGVGGLFNVAGQAFGLKKNREDFGQTLAHWNVGAGPYLVLPFFGPSTLRDSFGLALDSLIEPIPNIAHVETRNAAYAGKTIERRANLLSFDELMSGDSYVFIREYYLQYRDYLNEDGMVAVVFDEF